MKKYNSNKNLDGFLTLLFKKIYIKYLIFIILEVF